MINKLPRWAWLGGAMLAGNAGMVNAVGLQSFTHQAVTHVTGTVSLLSLAVSHGDGAALATLGLVVVAFAGGAAIGGFVVQESTLKLGRRYGAALAIEALLLAIAAILMRSHNSAGAWCASAACGLQNAMASSYSGTVLRTSHLTGMVTDLGVAGGHFLRGMPVDRIRVRLYGMLLGAFATGGVVGAWLFSSFSFGSLYIPAALTGTVAMIYTLYAQWRRMRVVPHPPL